MGFLSNLFGKEVEKAAKDLLHEISDDIGAVTNNSNETSEAPSQSYEQAPSAAEPNYNSWGDVMPSEENQYSYGGSYKDYFKYVFSSEFPEYSVDYTNAVGRRREAIICTFTKGGATALVVELMSEASNAVKLRQTCIADGVPYLRFYYDHDGWWNTKSYVVGRVRNALKF